MGDNMDIEKLRALIYHSINHHFYDGNDDGMNDCGIVINQVGNIFNIAFTEEHGECFVFTVEANPKTVANFLDYLKELKETLQNPLYWEVRKILRDLKEESTE